MGAERVGAAQARAEVVRIGHAVEDQQQRRLRRRLEHVVEGDVRHPRVHDGHDALVPLVAGQRDEPRAVDRMHGDVARRRA